MSYIVVFQYRANHPTHALAVTWTSYSSKEAFEQSDVGTQEWQDKNQQNVIRQGCTVGEAIELVDKNLHHSLAAFHRENDEMMKACGIDHSIVDNVMIGSLLTRKPLDEILKDINRCNEEIETE